MGEKKLFMLKLKEFFSKNIIWGVLLTIIVSFITIPNIITKAYDDKILKVLEVEPGNGFVLNNAYYDGYKVEVTKIDMPTFISMVNEIDGSYDVVYIGRDRKSAEGTELTGCWNVDPDHIYRDYSAPKKYPRVDDTTGGKEKTVLQGTKLGTKIIDRLMAQAYWYGTMGLSCADTTWNPQAQNGNVKTTINGVVKDVEEYYPENDITDRRAKEIIKMIDSDQLVYFNSDIFINDGSELDLQGTKLQSNFRGYFDRTKNDETHPDGIYPNCIKVDPINTDKLATEIITDYKDLSNSLKRPSVTMNNSPQSDSSDSTSDDRLANRNMTFSFSLTKSDSSIQYQPKLYLDFNADGIFEDTEAVKTKMDVTNVDANTLTYTLHYTLRQDFIGYLDWKIDVYDCNSPNVKTSVYGNAIYKKTGDKGKLIRVLQLTSSDKTYTNNLKLTSPTVNFNNQIVDSRVKDDYEIKMTTESVGEFNTEDKDYILSHYDMIIIGFADCYGNVDANKFEKNGIQTLKAFNDDHRSLLFTHDTISLNVLGNVTVYQSKDKLVKPYTATNTANMLTQSFRDIVGQSRYVDPYNTSSGVVNHDPSINDATINGTDTKITMGATAYASPTLWVQSAVDDKSNSIVKLINKAEINSYPFNLSDSNIPVSKTHVQWYQLNLEDPELVPWYNLTDNGNSNGTETRANFHFNSGDSRNFYYTYSRGNITYSGSGHSGGYTVKECQLFVNTIIKAIRGANVAPTVTNYDEKKTTEYTDNYQLKTKPSQPFKFSSLIDDQDGKDGDNMKYSIQIDNNTPITGTVQYKKGGVYTNEIPIDTAYLTTKIGKIIKVIVTVTDVYNATDSKTFSITVDPITPTQIYHRPIKPNAQITGPVWNSNNIINIIDYEGITKDYYTVVPFVAYINMLNTDADLTLTLDKKFSGAYSDSDYLVPTVYAVKDDALNRLGNMTSTDKIYYTFHLDKNIVGSNASIESNGNCNIVIIYNCKTYEHDTSSDNKLLSYINKISISGQGIQPLDQFTSINVGYQKLEGLLY